MFVRYLSALILTMGMSGIALASGAEHHAEPKKADRPVAELAKTCLACHGVNGQIADKTSSPTIPVLNGQYADYLENSLKGYRSKKRKNAIMQGQAAELTDGEIRALSMYFANAKAGQLKTVKAK